MVRKIRKCLNCKKGFLLKPNNKRYCSAKCRTYHYNNVKYAEHRRSKARERMRHRYSRNCNHCGKFYTGSGKLYCSRKCQNIVFKKQYSLNGNPAWQGGISFFPYPIQFNDILKEAIRTRDGHKCQICGVPQMECVEKLCVHHIDYNKTNCENRNLISLCRGCHLETNVDRKYWETYFMSKLEKVGY